MSDQAPLTDTANAALFLRAYLPFALNALLAASVLLRKTFAQEMLHATCLFVCTVAAGTAFWPPFFDILTDNASNLLTPDLFWMDQASIAQVREYAARLAWPLLALGGHYFIRTSAGVLREWRKASHRAAALLCALTLCVGVVSPFMCWKQWRQWHTVELPQLADDCRQVRELSDRVTQEMVEERPGHWQPLITRSLYLLQVGRDSEAQRLLGEALAAIPETRIELRRGVEEMIQRTTRQSTR